MLLPQTISSVPQAAGNYVLLGAAYATLQSGDTAQGSGAAAETTRSGAESFWGALLLSGALMTSKGAASAGLSAAPAGLPSKQVVTGRDVLGDVAADEPSSSKTDALPTAFLPAESSSDVVELSRSVDDAAQGKTDANTDAATNGGSMQVRVQPALQQEDSASELQHVSSEGTSKNDAKASGHHADSKHTAAKVSKTTDPSDAATIVPTTITATDYLKVVAALDVRSASVPAAVPSAASAAYPSALAVTSASLPEAPEAGVGGEFDAGGKRGLSGPLSLRGTGYSAVDDTAVPLPPQTEPADAVAPSSGRTDPAGTSTVLLQGSEVQTAPKAKTSAPLDGKSYVPPALVSIDSPASVAVDTDVSATPLAGPTGSDRGLPGVGMTVTAGARRMTSEAQTPTAAVVFPDAPAAPPVAPATALPAAERETTQATGVPDGTAPQRTTKPQVRTDGAAVGGPQAKPGPMGESTAPVSPGIKAASTTAAKGNRTASADTAANPQSAKKSEERRQPESATQVVPGETPAHLQTATVTSATGSLVAVEKPAIADVPGANVAAPAVNTGGVVLSAPTPLAAPVEAKGNHLEFAVQDASMGAIRIHAAVGSTGELRVNVAAGSEQARAELTEIAPLLHASVVQHVEASGTVASLHVTSSDTSTSTGSQPEQRQGAAASFGGSAAGGGQAQSSASRQQRPASTTYGEQPGRHSGNVGAVTTAAAMPDGVTTHRGSLSVRI